MCRILRNPLMNMKFVAILLVLQLQLPAAFLCYMTAEGVVDYLPKGWRNAVGRLHSTMGCKDGESEKPTFFVKPALEGYLNDLEHPGSYFRLDLKKEEGDKAGFTIGRIKDYLEVDVVLEAGAMAKWNAGHPSRALQPRDRITTINGVSGDSALMKEELQRSIASTSVSMRVFRIADRDRQAIETRKTDREIKKVLQEPPPPGLGHGIPEPSDSNVAVLHGKNIDKFTAKQPYALVMFYAGWCGHCKELAPEYRKAAAIVAGMNLPVSVKFAKFDDGDEANRMSYAAGNKFNYTSFPSLFWFKDGDHQGFYNTNGADEIAAHVAALARDLDPEEEIRKSLLKTRPLIFKPDTSPDTVLDLEPENFDDMVLREYEDNNRVWIIMYYSDKCPFCKSLKPEYIKAAEKIQQQFGSNVRFGAVNSRAFNDIAQRFGVTSYPWIISIYAGAKLFDMEGLGGWESVYNWAKERFENSWKKPAPKWNVMPAVSAPVIQAAGPSSIIVDNSTGTWQELLGRRTWFFLHTVAAKYPPEATRADGEAVKRLVAGLGQRYPCPACRSLLQQCLIDPSLGPTPFERTELTLWMCKLHNMVNSHLKKKERECNAFDLDLQYLKSCGECSVGDSVDKDTPDEVADWDFDRYLTEVSGRPKDEL